MIKFNPLVQRPSALKVIGEDGKPTETLKYPEVVITVRRMSHGMRSQVKVELAKVLEKVRDKANAIDSLVERGDFRAPQSSEDGKIVEISDSGEEVKPVKDIELTKEQLQIIDEISDINNNIEAITGAEVDPVYLRHGFHSITGITDENDKPYTWKTLYESGPEDLCLEATYLVKKEAGVAPEVKQSLELPSTSGAQVDGAKNNTSVPNAEIVQVGTELETAGSISLSR